MARLQSMFGQWNSFAFPEVLQAYRDFDFLLKRSFLTFCRTMPAEQAYRSLHEIWIGATQDLLGFYAERRLLNMARDFERLRDLIELSFFFESRLLNRSASSASPAPAISVILPVYRAQQFLWEALRSLYEQTFQDFEIILVNECGNDDPLEEILAIFGDTRTRIVQKTARARLGMSLNLGIRHARGEFIARMDADDIALPGRFAAQADFLRAHPDITLCGTQYRSFGTANNWSDKPYPLTHPEIQCRSLKYCCFLHPTVMWRRRELIEHGLWYNEEVLAEDTDLFARTVYTLQTANLPETLLLYRREGHNLSIANLKHKDGKQRSLAVVQSMELERNNLKRLYRTLSEEELDLVARKAEDDFAYGDALRIYRHRLGREDLSDLLPPDTSEAMGALSVNLNGRIPVIWGYGWNGQVLEYLLQEQGYREYRIVDQRLQALNGALDSPHAMKLEQLDGRSDAYYVLISMDKHFPDVTERLESFGYREHKDYLEFFLRRGK
ncbi:glycosyltransferase [Cohnella thermotolerans]|uniref:glycosyltransferase n=1 Tax=Cohnella thermotolerans TaxID=329858 RepID=UPI00042129F8|nr:glycosyltransferase [Cohnella thermotolerans]